MKKIFTALMFLAPGMALAATATPGGALSNAETGITNAAQVLTRTVNAVVPFFVAIAGIIFIFGVIRYVIATGPEEKKNAKSYIIWGIVAIAVILAVWGLVQVLINLFGLKTTLDPNVLPASPGTNPNAGI